MTPRVSVVVPVRDRRRLLRRCLDGLAAQTYEAFEVVVVDDGSTDGSAEEAVADARAGRPVRVIAGGGGAVASRIAGVAAARGEILAFTDSDCVPEPAWLAAGVAAVDAGADVVQGRTVPERPPRLLERTTAVGRDSGLFETCNVFYRRPAFDAAGGFDATAGERLGFRHGRALRGLGFGEDVLLGWRVRLRGRSTFAPDSVVRHAVFDVDPADALRRAWAAGGFPALVRDVPELRTTLLQRKVLLGTGTRLPLIAAVAALVTRRPVPAALGLTAWIAARALAAARWEPDRRRLARLLPLDLATDAVTAAALVTGSARARSLVL
jgi:hypothetical protein